MALSVNEQKLFDAGKGVLPRWFTREPAVNDWLGGFSKIFGSAWAQVDDWVANSFINQAVSFWLDQHAKDRGTSRQFTEADATLRNRLRNVDDAVTIPAITSAVNAVLLASGVTETAKVFALRGAHAYFRPQTRAFFSRGYRYGGAIPANHLVVILPYGTSTATTNAILETVRLKKAGGVVEIVETRGVP